MIGGNLKGVLQIKTTTKNEIGEKINSYKDLIELTGFLDFVSGDSSFRNNYKGKLEETTHVFICDYTEIDTKENECRLIINNKKYDVLLIDDVMFLHEHLEILLKYSEVSN